MIDIERSRRVGPSPALRDGLVVLVALTDGTVRPREQFSNAQPTTYTATPVKDQWGGHVARFDGISQRAVWADTASLERPSTAMTIWGRIKGSSWWSDGAVIGGKESFGGSTYSWGLEPSSTNLTVYLNLSGSQQVVATAAALPTGVWVSAFGRWAAGGPIQGEAYYDGGRVAVAPASSANFSGTITYDDGVFLMGADGTQTRFTGGDISHFALWNRRLADSELRLLAVDPTVLFRRTFLSGPFTAGHLAMFGQLVDQEVSPADAAIQRLDLTTPFAGGAALTVVRGGVPTTVAVGPEQTVSEPINSTDPQDPEYIRLEPDPGR